MGDGYCPSPRASASAEKGVTATRARTAYVYDPRPPMAPRTARTALAFLFAAALSLALLIAAPARADPTPSGAPATRVVDPGAEGGLIIRPGHEGEVLALLRPYAPGGPVTAGWSIGNVSIRREEIVVELHDARAQGAMVLRHPSRASDPYAVTPRFAITFEPDTIPRAVRDALVTSVRGGPVASVWAVPVGLGHSRWRLPRSVDGALLAALALAFLVASLRRHLRDAPRLAAVGLGLIGALGLALRLAIPVETMMNAVAYSRVVPLAESLYASTTLQLVVRARGRPISLVDLIFTVDLAMAALTPLALFAHARAVLRDWRASLVAALLLATLPMHLRFSRSDVEFLQSLLASSMTFVALYGALTDTSRAWRVVCAVALPAWSVSTYLTRPENMVFLPLDLAALVVASRGAQVPRARVVGVTALVAVPATVAIVTRTAVQYHDNLRDALGPATLERALSTLVDRRLNTLVNPSVTPPWLAPLAALGFVTLWRSGERARAAFLIGWLGAFFVAHSYVQAHEVEMQARYHLHLVTPMLLLVAATTPWLLARSRYAVAALVAASLAAPWVYLRFERDTAFYEMREYDFLRRVSARVPTGCTVLEFRGVPDARNPTHHFDARWSRFGARLGRGGPEAAWRVVTADVLAPGQTGAAETLSPEARETLRTPPPCTMVYLGLSCVAQRAEGTREAAVCDALRTAGRLDLVARETITGRVYDSMNIGHVRLVAARRWNTLALLPPGTPVTLALYRYRGADASPDGVPSTR